MAGLTEMDTSAAAVTVSEVDPDTEPTVAVTVVVPVPALAASPWLPLALLMVATTAWEELHCAVLVRSCVVLSVNVPVAVNC